MPVLTDGLRSPACFPIAIVICGPIFPEMPRPCSSLFVTFLWIAWVCQAQEESVNPGINAAYLRDDLIVTEWIERLENEGREIAANRAEIIRQAGITPGSTVADVGTGTGLFLPLLAEAAGSTGKVYAIDIVQKFLDHIEVQKARLGLDNVETVLCSERSIGLPADSIDVAFICAVYHHFEYPRDSLASIHRALRPGGRVVLIDFKRIPGESANWILNHMRAGQEVFEAEITAAGFTKSAEITGLLASNYFVIFTKSESRSGSPVMGL